jgi:uncharacterized protein (TIGR00269 family)
MKCKKCNEKAVINMRQHKLALCRRHFLDWIPSQTDRFIMKYEMFNRDNRILVAVSGGKDSLAIWDVLLNLGYTCEGLYIDLAIDEGSGYSRKSYEYATRFAEARKVTLHRVDVAQVYGASIPEAAKLVHRGRGKTCSICGLTKRYVMNRYASEYDFDVVVTGHNLDDEAAVLYGNTLHWQVGYLARQGPVLPPTPDGLVKKTKPFFRFYERETAAYAFLRSIEYIYEECPLVEGATSIYYKHQLNQLEFDRPGTKLDFYLSFLRAKEQITFHELNEGQLELIPCATCGQPTSAPEQCSFCRTWDHVRIRLS